MAWCPRQEECPLPEIYRPTRARCSAVDNRSRLCLGERAPDIQRRLVRLLIKTNYLINPSETAERFGRPLTQIRASIDALERKGIKFTIVNYNVIPPNTVLWVFPAFKRFDILIIFLRAFLFTWIISSSFAAGWYELCPTRFQFM